MLAPSAGLHESTDGHRTPKQAGFVDGDSLERLMENRLWRVPTHGAFRQDPRVVTPASNQGIHDERSRGPVPCADSQPLEARHVCAFFHLDEENRVLFPFTRDRFASRDGAFSVVDPKLREEHLGRLLAASIDGADWAAQVVRPSVLIAE